MLPQADIILVNGVVWRGLGLGTAEALALWSGRVLATGAADALRALAGPGTKIVDLAGRMALPGLNDAHLHLLPLGLAMQEVDLRPAAAPTLDALLGRIAAAASATPPGRWVLARGYDQGRLDARRHPTAAELDRVAPHHPVLVVRTCGHLAVLNGAGLHAAGIDAGTASPEGGLIERRDGVLTGLVAERALDAVRAQLPRQDQETLVAAIERAGRHCLELGVTSVMDAAVGMRAGLAELAAYNEARRSGRLPVRTYQCLLGGPEGIADEAVARGLVTGAGDAMLMTGPLKLFTDGSAGGRTAAMRAPYRGAPETRGILCIEQAELRRLVRHHHDQGWQLALHAIGDAAIDQVLDAYEAALGGVALPERRHRIEHCGFVDAAQRRRMVLLGITPSPQPVFMRDFGDLYVEVLGEERAAAAYPMAGWRAEGFATPAGTDAPVCAVDPIANIAAMVTRATIGGTVLGAGERLGIEDALAAYTRDGAWASFAEAEKGRLVPGQRADVAVLSHDLLTLPAERLGEVRCELTILDGRIVHGTA